MLGKDFRERIDWVEEEDPEDGVVKYSVRNIDDFEKMTKDLCVLARSSP